MSETFVVNEPADVAPYLGKRVRATGPAGTVVEGVVVPDGEPRVVPGFAIKRDGDRGRKGFVEGDVVEVIGVTPADYVQVLQSTSRFSDEGYNLGRPSLAVDLAADRLGREASEHARITYRHSAKAGEASVHLELWVVTNPEALMADLRELAEYRDADR